MRKACDRERGFATFIVLGAVAATLGAYKLVTRYIYDPNPPGFWLLGGFGRAEYKVLYPRGSVNGGPVALEHPIDLTALAKGMKANPAYQVDPRGEDLLYLSRVFDGIEVAMDLSITDGKGRMNCRAYTPGEAGSTHAHGVSANRPDIFLLRAVRRFIGELELSNGQKRELLKLVALRRSRMARLF